MGLIFITISLDLCTTTSTHKLATHDDYFEWYGNEEKGTFYAVTRVTATTSFDWSKALCKQFAPITPAHACSFSNNGSTLIKLSKISAISSPVPHG